MVVKKPMSRQKRRDRRKAKYGMGPKEWAKFKRTNPKEAHELYMRVGGLV